MCNNIQNKKITMKYIILFVLISCTKPEIQHNPIPCTMAYYISEKYTIDTILLKIDTLWKDCVSKKEIDTIKTKGIVWIPFCSPPHLWNPVFILEKTYYIIK